MKKILLLLLICITGNAIAQALPKAPVVAGKKVKSVTKYAVGYDRYSKESQKSIIEKFDYDATGNCIAMDYYYQITYADYKPTDTPPPRESQYDFRNKQKLNSVKYTYTFDAKGRLTAITSIDQDGSKTTSKSDFNDKGQEVKIVFKSDWQTTTTHKKYDVDGNLIITKTYSDKGIVIGIDSIVFNNKNQRVFQFTLDTEVSDYIYYTYNDIDSAAAQYWLVSENNTPSKRDTTNIILYEYDDKNRHVHTLEYINVSGLNDLHTIEYQYSPDGGYTVWFKDDKGVYLNKTYDAKGKAVVQIDKPNTVVSVIKKYFHNADGLLDHIDSYNSENRLIDKEVYEYTYFN